jgi:hypothetical protein
MTRSPTMKRKHQAVSICALCGKHNLSSLVDCPLHIAEVAAYLRRTADLLERISLSPSLYGDVHGR